MDVFLTPDKIPARPVLKEIHSNDIMNNKSPAADESNGSLGEFAKTTPNTTNSKSFVLPETPFDKNGQVNEADTTCDELIKNINSLALNTPQHLKATNAQNENCNSPSSDDEVFEECENTFGGTPNAKIVSESGYRTVNYNNDTLDATINFSAHIANSTTTSAAANLTDRFAALSRKSNSFSSHLDATANVSGNGQTVDSMPSAVSVGTLDRTIQSNIDSIETSGISSMNSLDVIRQDAFDLPANTVGDANGTLTIESDGESISDDPILEEVKVDQKGTCAPDILGGPLTEPTDVQNVSEDVVAQSDLVVPNAESLELNVTFSNDNHVAEAIGPLDLAKQPLPDLQKETPEVGPIQMNHESQNSVVNDRDATQPILDETQNVVDAAKDDSPAVIKPTEREEVVDVKEVTQPEEIAETNEVTESLEVARTEEVAETEIEEKVAKLTETVNANTTVDIEHEIGEPMDVSMCINDTFSEPMDVSMAMEPQTIDEQTQLPPEAHSLNEIQSVSNTATSNIGPEPAQMNDVVPPAFDGTISMGANDTASLTSNDNTFEPNTTIILNANAEMAAAEENHVLGDATFCAPQKVDEVERSSANLNQTVLIDSNLPNRNTTFSAQPSVDVVDETLNQTSCPANEMTFQVNPQKSKLANPNSTFFAQSTFDVDDEILNQTKTITGDATFHVKPEISKVPNPIKFFAQSSLEAIDETAIQTKCSVSETTFQVKPETKRISFGLDATVSSPLINQTMDLTVAPPSVSNDNDVFKIPNAPISASGFGETKLSSQKTFDISDDEFQSGGMILNPSDFEFLLSKGETPKNKVSRDSILERFDPLSSRKSVIHSIPIGAPLTRTREESKQQSTPQSQQPNVANQRQHQKFKSPAAIEIDVSPKPFDATILKLDSPELSFDKNRAACDSPTSSSSDTYVTASLENTKSNTGNAKMSVGLIHDMNTENMKSMEQVDIHDESNLKMNDEKNVKHDFVEDIQRKLKEAEAREESLIRRITEKDKAMNKMSAVMENYEKTMVEMITEREQTTQNYEKQMIQLKAECDANFHHLTSLENTFSDLHAKYEKSKQLTLEIKENETKLLEKLEFAQQQMKLQEQRYDKLKNHAFTQLENANAKLEALTKSHSNDIKKLSAQLKKEEISRQSIMEQLAQKTKENEELVKICDELINNGPDGS